MMSRSLDEWHRLLSACSDYPERLNLVRSLEDDPSIPEHLRRDARLSRQTLELYLSGDHADSINKHNADHKYQSLKFAFP